MMSKYINVGLDAYSKANGQSGKVELEYNQPVKVPQNFTAECSKTTQTKSALMIKNQSAAFEATVYVDPDPLGKGYHTLSANAPSPIYFPPYNFGGAKLIIANMSQEAATVVVTLAGQTYKLRQEQQEQDETFVTAITVEYTEE